MAAPRGTRVKAEGAGMFPIEVSDDAAIAALSAERRADFARNGVVRYAVAFEGWAIFGATAPLAALPTLKRDSIVIEAAEGSTAVRLCVKSCGRRSVGLISRRSAR